MSNLDVKYTISLDWKLEISNFKIFFPLTINVAIPDEFYLKHGDKIAKLLDRSWRKEISFL